MPIVAEALTLPTRGCPLVRRIADDVKAAVAGATGATDVEVEIVWDPPWNPGMASEHVRDWDSCFTRGHSYLHGLTVRPDTRSRYRQWLTHKLATWHDQYGRSGCVGCGRCIAWCPVGIDLTQVARALVGERA